MLLNPIQLINGIIENRRKEIVRRKEEEERKKIQFDLNDKLFHAIVRGQLEKMQLLLENGADANADTDDTYERPLLAAIYAWAPCEPIMELLIKYGADPNYVCKNGRALYWQAGWSNRRTAQRYLLNHGAVEKHKTIESILILDENDNYKVVSHKVIEGEVNA